MHIKAIIAAGNAKLRRGPYAMICGWCMWINKVEALATADGKADVMA
jgi:hypothetical protein